MKVGIILKAKRVHRCFHFYLNEFVLYIRNTEFRARTDFDFPNLNFHLKCVWMLKCGTAITFEQCR